MQVTMLLPFEPDRRWQLARQVGVTHAVVKLAPELTGRNPPWELDLLAEAQKRFHEAGFTLLGLEGDQFDMSKIKLGLPGREEDLDHYRQMLRNMGKLNLTLLCYNFMAGVGWFRTNHSVSERGGAQTLGFEHVNVKQTESDLLSEEQLWANYRYFLNAVLPVAEEQGVRMALHPDDPPLPELKGFARIFHHADGFRKAMALSTSPAHALTFCQANFFLMGENVPDLVRQWRDRIAFVHFRDVRGTADSFVETFHDNGPHSMAEMINVYQEIGFDGPIRTDHAPSLAGEESTTGYEILGHLFAIGYLKGLWEATRLKKDN